MPAVSTTVVSTKGQVILPKAVRDHLNWGVGTRLTVEETPQGILLKAAPLFKPTRIEDVAGCLNPNGRHLTIEDMDGAIGRGAMSHYDRD